MANTFQIKRRTSDASAPATLAGGELAFNEVGSVFYIGKQSSVEGIGGEGRFLTLDTVQSLTGDKVFADQVALSSAVTTTQPTTATDSYVATTEFVQNVFSVLDGGDFDNNVTPAGTGKYWYSTGNTSWFTVGNWYTDVAHQQPAANLPDGTIDVITLGAITPQVDLDNGSWVQPSSIDATATGIVFTSQNYVTVTCDISGSITFNGNAIFGP